MTQNPFHKNYRNLQRWQIRCQENYVERLRRLAPGDLRALAQAEATLVQMQAVFASPAVDPQGGRVDRSV